MIENPYAYVGEEPFMPSVRQIERMSNMPPTGGLTKNFLPISERLLQRARYSVSVSAVLYGESPDPYFSVMDWVFANVYPCLSEEMVAASRGKMYNPIRSLKLHMPTKTMCTMDLLVARAIKSAYQHRKRNITPSWANLPVSGEENPAL